jgi:hypothetical protein
MHSLQGMHCTSRPKQQRILNEELLLHMSEILSGRLLHLRKSQTPLATSLTCQRTVLINTQQLARLTTNHKTAEKIAPPLQPSGLSSSVLCVLHLSQTFQLPLQLVGLERLELSTPRLSSVCSNQLSYRPLYLLKTRARLSLFIIWWSWTGSNRRHPACKAGALPAELQPHFNLCVAMCSAVRPRPKGAAFVRSSVMKLRFMWHCVPSSLTPAELQPRIQQLNQTHQPSPLCLALSLSSF